MQTNATTRLVPGDRTLTRRILKRCRDSGIKYKVEEKAIRIGHRRWGTTVVAYSVPEHIFQEESARRDEEKQAAESKVRAKLQAKLREKFPHLSQSTIESLSASGKQVSSHEETGYQHGVATKSYWKQLGFAAISEPTGVVVIGNRLYDTYRSFQVRPIKSRITVERLEAEWLQKYGDEKLALAQAVRIANRLQKVRRHPDFYDLKDRWIESHQDHLTLGRITRIENQCCWGCMGTGTSNGRCEEDECERCDGTGIYSSRTLYEHQFEIAGQRFVFHSRICPESLSNEPATNSQQFGRPFTSNELPCPPQDVLVRLIQKLFRN